MVAQAYEGSCQCGAVRYEVTADLDRTISCNCSRCGRPGTIQAFVPATDFTLRSVSESLTGYLFNKHAIHHLFCKVCGVQSFSRGNMRDGTPMVAVNARCLDGVEPDDLKPQKFDGRSR